MQINLSEILSCEGKVFQIKTAIEMEVFESKLGSFPIAEKSELLLTLQNEGDRQMLLEAEGQVVLLLPCDRCLEDVKIPFELSVSKKFDMKESSEERVRNMDESNEIAGEILDTEKLVFGEILLQWPVKLLCRKDCKGICTKCGINLNRETCDCDRTSLDPRMAAILDIFQSSQHK